MLADAARGSGAFALTSTGGIMKTKGAVILATFTLAAGTAGFGTAVAIGARTEAVPRADTGPDRARAESSVAMLDQIARLEERARLLEEENRALRTEGPVGPDSPTPAGSNPAKKAGSPFSLEHVFGALGARGVSQPLPAPLREELGNLVERWRARLRESPNVQTLKQGEEILRKTRDFRAVEKVYREQLETLGESSVEGRVVLVRLGHLHRYELKYRESDESYERLKAITGAQDPEHAEALFHLAWNRRFEKDWDAAMRLFDDAGRAPGATRQTAAISRYNYAQLLEKTGDTGRARIEYADVTREYAKDESTSTQYYVELARKRVDALG
jgi:tetratricopeptide (TPR) repeat protein